MNGFRKEAGEDFFTNDINYENHTNLTSNRSVKKEKIILGD
jgi:hypothetical protein